jgi:hypothetical protein
MSKHNHSPQVIALIVIWVCASVLMYPSVMLMFKCFSTLSDALQVLK